MGQLRTIFLDFESYYDKDYNLRKLSYPEYIMDKRFKVHGMALIDGKRVDMIRPAAIPKVLKAYDKAVVVGHNLNFDAAVLAWRYDFRPAYYIDTLLLANHVLGSAREGAGRNDLGTLAERLGLEAKGRPDFFKGVRDLDEEQWAALRVYALQDVKLTKQIYDRLFPQVSNPDLELWLADHTLRIYLEKHLGVNPEMISKTKRMIEDRRQERVSAAGVNNKVLVSNKQFANELIKRMTAAKLQVPMKQGKRGPIPALAKQDAAFLKLAEHENDSIRNLIRGRLVERSAVVALARLRTLEKFKRGIPVHLVYYGAHTGRFSAGGGFNFQNLTSPDRAIDPVDREIAASIRAAIVPGEGQVFVAVDAAQIEARVLAWLAGEQSILEAFGLGVDIYSQFISGVLGEDIHKPKGDEPEAVQKHLKLMRHVGKEAVLGLGYSMGVEKFMYTLRSRNREVAKMIEAGKINVKLAAKIVYSYRDTYPAIVDYWSRLNDAFKAGMFGARREVGFIDFRRLDRSGVAITLPSGRRLNYRNIRSEFRSGTVTYIDKAGKKKEIEQKGREYKHGNGQRIYGGLLAENVTQAVARDILVEQGIVAAERAGYPVVLHVHDEVVCRVPEVQGPAALSFLIKSLSTPPEWGQGLVLNAEGKVSKTLSK